MLIFIQYILPALISALSAVLAVWLSTRVQHQKIVDEDDASLRGDLMAERKELVKEIQELQKRCDDLEEQNRQQAGDLLTLQDKNRQLIEEIKHFGSGLPNE